MKALIIGFGIAGCILSEKLLLQGVTVDVMDAGEKYCASFAGASIINPVTGKRLVLDPDFTRFYDHALDFYKNWSLKNQIPLWHPKPYWRVLDKEQQEIYDKKSNIPAYQPFLSYRTDFLDHQHYFGQKIFEIQGVGYIDFTLFQEKQKKKIRHFIAGLEDFIPQKSSTTQVLPTAFESDYDAVFLTEGSLAIKNPFLADIPWELAKGETTILHMPDIEEDRFLQQEVFFLPLGDHYFKIGASYQWDNLDFLPSPGIQTDLLHKFSSLCRISYTIAEHKVGIRPIVKDRKPMLGKVKGFEQLYVLNGLGSKGALLAPLCAELLVNHCLKGAEIPSAWSVQRFFKD